MKIKNRSKINKKTNPKIGYDGKLKVCGHGSNGNGHGTGAVNGAVIGKRKSKLNNYKYYVRFYFTNQPNFNSRAMPTKLGAAFELVERIKYYYDISNSRKSEVPYKGEIRDMSTQQVIFDVEMKIN